MIRNHDVVLGIPPGTLLFLKLCHQAEDITLLDMICKTILLTSKMQGGKLYQERCLTHLQYVSFCQVIHSWTRKYHLTHVR